VSNAGESHSGVTVAADQKQHQMLSRFHLQKANQEIADLVIELTS
jgi:hypothetical protein|tara:strand:- start:1213 stop:1347 length:135 start_codon:yes stop_codon:yes gene_type:complete